MPPDTPQPPLSARDFAAGVPDGQDWAPGRRRAAAAGEDWRSAALRLALAPFWNGGRLAPPERGPAGATE